VEITSHSTVCFIDICNIYASLLTIQRFKSTLLKLEKILEYCMSSISIVIPAYNEAVTIEKIILQVIELKFGDSKAKEIIVVDDCSKDSTEKIVKKLARKYPQIQLITNEKNLGKSQSVKRGILATTCDYVVIQDADMEYNPKNLIKMYN
jgi:glycosyltransferase involved in cell wall biosynthesis